MRDATTPGFAGHFRSAKLLRLLSPRAEPALPKNPHRARRLELPGRSKRTECDVQSGDGRERLHLHRDHHARRLHLPRRLRPLRRGHRRESVPRASQSDEHDSGHPGHRHRDPGSAGDPHRNRSLGQRLQRPGSARAARLAPPGRRGAAARCPGPRSGRARQVSTDHECVFGRRAGDPAHQQQGRDPRLLAVDQQLRLRGPATPGPIAASRASASAPPSGPGAASTRTRSSPRPCAPRGAPISNARRAGRSTTPWPTAAPSSSAPRARAGTRGIRPMRISRAPSPCWRRSAKPASTST